MSNVYFISDLHLGHSNILSFTGNFRAGSSVEEHDQILKENWNHVINKKDKVFVLGDIAFTKKGLESFSKFNGRKVLIKGNHDDLVNASEYLEYFDEIHGLYRYKGFWLSHCPIHPNELRDRRNIHGHVHMNSIRDHYAQIDQRYINVCVESCGGIPVPFKKIESGEYQSK